MQKLWDRFFKEKKGSLTGLTRYQKWLLFKTYYTTGPGAKEKALWEGTFLDYEKWRGSGKEISAWWNENVKDDSDSDEDIEITDEEIEAIATESTRDFEFEAQTPQVVSGRPTLEDSKLYQDLNTYLDVGASEELKDEVDTVDATTLLLETNRVLADSYDPEI